MDTCVCTVLAVKPFSGYYPSCGSCLRKLRRVETSGSTSLWCGWCPLAEYTAEEAPQRYCVALTVTDTLSCADVVLFGEKLDPVFGASASELHQYLIQKSLGHQDFTAYTSTLLRELLQTALVGRCFLFQFTSKCSNKTTRTQLSDLLQNSEAHNRAASPHCSLIATSMRPLGSSGRSATVVALLEELFTKRSPLHDPEMGDLGTFRGHESSEEMYDSPRNQQASSEAATSGPEEKDSSSYLYDPSHLCASETTSTGLLLESYYAPSATRNCSSCCVSTSDQSTCTFVDLSSCTSANKLVKLKSGIHFHQSSLTDSSESEMCSDTALNSVHYKGVSDLQFQLSSTEARFSDFYSLNDSEVLKDLTSDWETQVQTSLVSSKNLPLVDTQLEMVSTAELETKSDSSFSNLGETFLTEFQRSFSDPTPSGRHSVSVSNTSSISAFHSCVATPHAYICSPELFPDSASASSKEHYCSNPVSSVCSPELFSRPSSIEQKLSFVSDSAANRRDSGTSKHSHTVLESSNIFTPQILRHSSAPRRNILRDVTNNRGSGGPRLIVGAKLGGPIAGTPMTPHDSVKRAALESVPFSPDLFSP